MADEPRKFSVKVEYNVTVGAISMTNDNVKRAIEEHIHLELFRFRRETSIDIDVINSAVVIEELP